MLVIAAVCACPAGSRAAPSSAAGEPAPADTLRAQLELGGSTDYSNEIFYEDDVDTTFLKRQLVASPQAQISGVGRVTIDGTHAGRAAAYHVQNDVSIGNLVQSDVLELRGATGSELDTRYDLVSELGWRHDQSFDRDFTELREEGYARARASLGEGSVHGEMGGRWDFQRTSGPSAGFIPDRNAGGGWLAFERMPLYGTEWRFGYALTTRAYPDSIERDHVAHTWEARVREELGGGGFLELESTGERRVTIHPAPTSRDRFLNADASALCRLRLDDALALDTRLDGEWFNYDEPDSVYDFNYRVGHASLALRFDRLPQFSATLGPRLQWLRSPMNPAESYDECAAMLELEWLKSDSWWSVSPSIGRRDYLLKPDRDAFDDVGLHSSYWFVDLGWYAEQPLAGGWRLHTLGAAHAERHDQPSDDARSLYFSLDIRRLF